MIVIILDSVPVSLRGELSRWLLEPKAGVFVGEVSSMVRDRLWQKVCSKSASGSCMMIYRADTEQGFQIDFWGGSSRIITNWEGLQLVTKR